MTCRSSGKTSRWFSKKPAETKEQETLQTTTTNEEPAPKDQKETISKSIEVTKETDHESEKMKNEKSKEENGKTLLTQQEVYGWW